ncbi:unnamed protein product [Paramecium sonneborni]|uniref:Uncharacterized protein n=1 Tax=Paramecium sonneborni TaxID=65129 RepID=A0A8S1N6L5_9CILI|nr:unnamed protein product [Paramecium sonneborni]
MNREVCVGLGFHKWINRVDMFQYHIYITKIQDFSENIPQIDGNQDNQNGSISQQEN